MSLRLPQISGLRLVLFLLFFQLINSVPQDVFGEMVATEKWNISADKIFRYENPNSIVAQGNVILEKNEKIVPRPNQKQGASDWSELLEEKVEEPVVGANQVEKVNTPEYHITVTINADWIVYDVELESIKAKGNVHITTNDEQLFAKEATLNLTKDTGKFNDATILRNAPPLHLEGKSVEKTGFDTYHIDDGWVITCKLTEGETPPWSIASADTEITKGGYAVLKNAWFNIKDVPIFYTPYMILPAKNTRQTGFLFPYFSTSNISGVGLDLPFFLNISDSADATFFPEYYSKRGFMPGAEFRYASSDTNKGLFSASFLNDALSEPSNTSYFTDTKYTHNNVDRYWIRGKADESFGDAWRTRLDLDIVSDQDYLTEFNSSTNGFSKTHSDYLQTFGRGFQNETDINRQNSLKTVRRFKGMALEADLVAIDEIDTNASTFNTQLWSLPSVTFAGAVPIGETYSFFDWKANYVNYWRKDGIGGQRIDLNPDVSVPIPISPYLETLATVALRDTFYDVHTYGTAAWNNNVTQNRLLPDYKIETATTLERDYFTGDSTSEGFTHQVRPFVKYEYIPFLDQTNLPQWDDIDLISQRNTFTYGMLTSLNPISPSGQDKVSLSGQDKGKRNPWDKLTLLVQQSYHLYEDPSNEPFSAIYGKLSWSPSRFAKIIYKSSYDVYDHNFTSHTFGGQYRDSRGDRLGVDYSYKAIGYTELNDTKSTPLTDEIKQINANFRTTLPFVNNWIAGAKIEHSLSQDTTTTANSFLTYMAPCWSVTFLTQHTTVDTAFIVSFNLANIGIGSAFGIPLGSD